MPGQSKTRVRLHRLYNQSFHTQMESARQNRQSTCLQCLFVGYVQHPTIDQICPSLQLIPWLHQVAKSQTHLHLPHLVYDNSLPQSLERDSETPIYHARSEEHTSE